MKHSFLVDSTAIKLDNQRCLARTVILAARLAFQTERFSGRSLCFMQCPNLPMIGYAQSVLIRDSRGRDSFTEDALLSA